MLKWLKKLFRRRPKAVMIKNIRFRQLDEEIRNKMVDGLGTEDANKFGATVYKGTATDGKWPRRWENE